AHNFSRQGPSSTRTNGCLRAPTYRANIEGEVLGGYIIWITFVSKRDPPGCRLGTFICRGRPIVESRPDATARRDCAAGSAVGIEGCVHRRGLLSEVYQGLQLVEVRQTPVAVPGEGVVVQAPDLGAEGVQPGVTIVRVVDAAVVAQLFPHQ